MFVASLEQEGLSSSTVKGYLEAVLFTQISEGWPDPQWSQMPRLGLVLKGVRRSEASRDNSSVSRRLVTPAMLEKLQEIWDKKPDRDSRMLWAACCTCYFGCLRAGEVTAPEKGEFDPGVHLMCRGVRQRYLHR